MMTHFQALEDEKRKKELEEQAVEIIKAASIKSKSNFCPLCKGENVINEVITPVGVLDYYEVKHICLDCKKGWKALVAINLVYDEYIEVQRANGIPQRMLIERLLTALLREARKKILKNLKSEFDI